MTQILLSYVFFVPQISQIYTDFTTIRFLCHADFADFSYPILLLNQMKKNLRHPIDRTGLNLCKSVKSVGKKYNQKKSASSAKSA